MRQPLREGVEVPLRFVIGQPRIARADHRRRHRVDELYKPTRSALAKGEAVHVSLPFAALEEAVTGWLGTEIDERVSRLAAGLAWLDHGFHRSCANKVSRLGLA